MANRLSCTKKASTFEVKIQGQETFHSTVFLVHPSSAAATAALLSHARHEETTVNKG